MSEHAWNWLPEGALSDPAALAPLDETLADWCRRWLPDDRLRCQAPVFGIGPDPHSAVAEGRHFALQTPRTGPDALAARAMAVDLARLEIGEGDRKIIDAFRDEMLADLSKTLDGAAGLAADAPADRSGAVQIAVSDRDGRKVLILMTTRAVLAQMRRSRLPKRTARRSPLSSIRSATADATVSVSAHLGSAVMPVSEARRLAAGDVIILDRNLDEPIELTTIPDGASLACGILVDTASPRSLRLQPSSSRASS
ncbi:MAG TPA: FliM/FliN family flagellar motor C-terminal domain-containing protein [Brevundimonas sp.]|nr:FliM/FliN family flagellar motor C-terminal domain-containing protein [Brevundimonas sp.]